MFPTFHLKWGPQYGSPSPSCQTHLLCSSESDVRTLVPGCEEWRKLCQNVVQHGLVSTHFNQVRMWKSVHIRFFLHLWIPTPHPSYPQLGFQKNSTEHHWTPLNEPQDIYIYMQIALPYSTWPVVTKHCLWLLTSFVPPPESSESTWNSGGPGAGFVTVLYNGLAQHELMSRLEMTKPL